MVVPKGSGRPGRYTLDGVQDPTDPNGRARVEAWLSIERFERIKKLVRWKAANVKTALEVLQSPERIYHGIRGEEDGGPDGWCYVGRPKYLLDARLKHYPRPEGTLFLAFIDGERNLFEWRVEDCLAGDQETPQDADGRFTARIWPEEI